METEVYIPNKLDAEAISIATREERVWRNGDIYITDEISYQMRKEVKRNRKNYYGKFLTEQDKATGLDKIFVPLTEWSVETMVKNVDLDLKDISIKAPCPDKIGTAEVLRLVLNTYLKKINFGETLNDVERRAIIDGTCIVKVQNVWNEEFKRKMVSLRIVDFLNFYIDPASRSIQEAPATIEKHVMTIGEFREIGKKWKNIEFAKPSVSYNYTDSSSGYTKEEVPVIEVFERYGKIKKSWITGNESDENIWIDGRIIYSNLKENPVVHLIEKNKSGLKPYEELWMRRVPSRWAGRGVPEMLKGLQLYANTTVNIRRNTGLVVQTGLFKIRKGAGITQQNLSSLKAGGAIPVDNMDDIQELRTGDVKASSYQDENNIYNLAERVTGVKELPTSPTTEPTTAVIQQQDVRSASNMVKENIGFFLKRLLKRHIIPLLVKSLNDREVLRLTCNQEELKLFDESIINYFTNKSILEFYKKTGTYPTQAQIDSEKERARKKFQLMGSDRFVEIWKDNFDVDFDIDVMITGEEFDKAVMIKQLNDLLFAYSKLPSANIDINSIMRQIFDIMGLQSNSLMLGEKEVSEQQAQAQAQAKELPQPNKVGMTQQFSQATNPLSK